MLINVSDVNDGDSLWQIALNEVQDILTIRAKYAAGPGAVSIFPKGCYACNYLGLSGTRAKEISAARVAEAGPPGVVVVR